MNELFLKEDFLTEINYLRLIFGLILLLGMTSLIRLNYLRNSFSNDNKLFFAKNIYTFSIAITLIVVVIKSSLALSLGLIGALSIIRFRTAIKEPEQIITLLMLMAVSISIAAEKEILGVIMTIIYILLNRFSTKTDVKIVKRLLIISFTSDESIKLEDLNIKESNRIYKTSEGSYTIEYLLVDSEIASVISHFSDTLKMDIEYEVS
ncbi:DUF4956 domain-containing protein [Flavobacteriaceae bacterium]|nr:DUF4956 domain-containing protein [Flavobacteriaceae bacterium]